ncbi:hypothetical protein [Flavisolibacter ginsenosidimutans]|uniref:HEPN domain-containing protein n=1 Tax=Flavisolibacter ginsenosidimutans TaxID=661481 RepID=A0A5B8UGC2_9BACT|nr:hypothetical protein [Flavisolibacter ginsenosidimutans]QEC55711.1 hypothetical protein FSB75_07335 [Flavisolibacter ginsenosidimutans]
MSKLVELQDWLQQNEKVEKQEVKLFLTEKELRSYPKYKYASDEEVQNAILTFHKLALACYQAFCKEEKASEAKNYDITSKQ